MTMKNPSSNAIEGLLLVNKSKGQTSFSLVSLLRRRLGVKKIGHAGTLDPFATGVMVMLIGRSYTRLSDQFLLKDKEYIGEAVLGAVTDTYDSEGVISPYSDEIPTFEQIQKVINEFQGEIEQVPPMFSAKKVNGKKLYDLARKGVEVERVPNKVHVNIHLLSYQYPLLQFKVLCSKGTYIRSLAHDIGLKLGCGAYLNNLQRTKSGTFELTDCLDESIIRDPHTSLNTLTEKLQTIDSSCKFSIK